VVVAPPLELLVACMHVVNNTMGFKMLAAE